MGGRVSGDRIAALPHAGAGASRGPDRPGLERDTDCPGCDMTSKHEPAQSLPKAGALCAQWVRCGTSGCRCNRGELHGPYYYWFWREGGRLRKRYVRLSDVL